MGEKRISRKQIMIVMKFGGSSVEDAAAIKRVAGIVKEHSNRQPVVVVSAMSGTTDRLLDLARFSSEGRQYEAWHVLDLIQQQHFDAAARVNDRSLEDFLKESFKTLHLYSRELSEDGAPLTPGLADEIVSYGERVSSRIVASFLLQEGVSAALVDVRKLIVTDSRFTRARPKYWETYGRIRWSLPHLVSCGSVPVLGGFIGSSEKGETTTLGRGGSDLTAAIIGAGINAEEIQIWTDVDGVLSCDPRVFVSGISLEEISYSEAAEMAKAGAKVLHPQTVSPAARLRIPIVVRNSRNPQHKGTRITATVKPSSRPVKSIACIQDLDILEIRPMSGERLPGFARSIENCLERAGVEPDILQSDRDCVFVGISKKKHLPPLAALPSCTSVRMRTDCAALTVVGDGSADRDLLRIRSEHAMKLASGESFVLPSASKHSLAMIVPQRRLVECTVALHREWFGGPAEGKLTLVKTGEIRQQSRDKGFAKRILKIQPVLSNS